MRSIFLILLSPSLSINLPACLSLSLYHTLQVREIFCYNVGVTFLIPVLYHLDIKLEPKLNCYLDTFSSYKYM